MAPLSYVVPRLLEKATYVTLGVVFLGLLVAAALVRNVAFIAHRPLSFLLELFAMSVLTALPLYVFLLTRPIGGKKATIFFALFLAKLALLHVLLEISGFYGYVFS
jgi:hypothetical protein